MSKESIRDDLANEPALRRAIQEMGEPVLGLGAIPEGHEGPYHPTPDEFLQATRRVIEANAELAELRAELAIENLRQTDLDQREAQQ